MKKQKKKIKPMEVYLGNIERAIQKGLADKPQRLNEAEVQVGYEILYSKHSERCYYYVKALPEYLTESFYDNLRMYLRAYKTAYPVSIHYRVQGKPHFIDWESSDMKQRRAAWQNYEKSKAFTDDRFADSKTRTTNSVDDWRIKSWDYIQSAEDRKVQLIDCEMTIELSVDGTTKEHKRSLLDICQEFEQWCAKQGIKIKKVKNNMADFLKYTSMTSLNRNTTHAKKIMNRVLSSEILAEFLSYVPGKINDTGVLFGIDILTGMAVYKCMVRPDGQAENFLVLAETGAGKSVYMKAIAFQMLINGFHQVVLDIDGEYKPFAEQVGGVVIDMSKSAGLYFDSTVIGDPTGDPELDSSLLAQSRTTTTNIFSLLCDPAEGMTHTELKLFNDAYNNLYEKYGIVAGDPSTWKNSKDLSFYKLYVEICLLQETSKYAAYEEDLRKFIDKLYVFFDPKGLSSYLFKKPISLAEILAKKTDVPMFLDIVLNLESEPAAGKQDIEALIKQATATYLVTLVTNYFKSKGEFTVHYIEEYQRYAASPGVASLVVYMVTGNRKRNAATFIISNSPTALLKTNGLASSAITDNINNYIIGKVSAGAAKCICETFALESCKNDLLNISRYPHLYNHTFLLKINNQDTTLVRQFLPAKVAEGKLFKTRDTKKKQEV